MTRSSRALRAAHWQKVWAQALTIFRTPSFWLFFAAMFVAGGGEFCLTFWCASYIQLVSWMRHGRGVGTACFAGEWSSAGLGLSGPPDQLKHLIIWSALAGTFITPVFRTSPTCGLFVLFAGATGPFLPSVQSYCADRLPQVDTTMLFILLSCAGVPGCGSSPG